MISRIRYDKNDDGTLVSREVFLYNGVKNKIYVDMNTLTYKIGVPDAIITSGQAQTKHKLKRLIKNDLKRLGFNFKNERRKRPVTLKVKSNEQS